MEPVCSLDGRREISCVCGTRWTGLDWFFDSFPPIFLCIVFFSTSSFYVLSCLALQSLPFVFLFLLLFSDTLFLFYYLFLLVFICLILSCMCLFNMLAAVAAWFL